MDTQTVVAQRAEGPPDAPDPSGAADDAVARVFKALADPTRRRVVERLGTRTVSTSDLAADFDMALPSFLSHLRLLEESGLIRSAKVGRVRTYQLVPESLEQVARWLDERRQLWEQRLDQLDNYLHVQHRAARLDASQVATRTQPRVQSRAQARKESP